MNPGQSKCAGFFSQIVVNYRRGVADGEPPGLTYVFV